MAPEPSDEALRARIASASGLTIKVLTLTCDGPCADVVADVEGGNPPYSVQWDDGSSTMARRVCPGAAGALQLEVTDTAISGTEFGYEAQTASATVTLQSLQCAAPDAGMPVDAGSDAGPEVPACEMVSIPRATVEAEGCQPLAMRYCGSTLLPPTAAMLDLPYPLVPDNQSCLVAFGNTRSLTMELLSVYIAGALNECGADEVLWGEGFGQGPLPPNSDPEYGRVLCLSNPGMTFGQLFVSPDTSARTFGDLELWMCEVCPR